MNLYSIKISLVHTIIYLEKDLIWQPTKFVYQISTALLVVIFALAGLIKVVPGITQETSYELVSEFPTIQVSVIFAQFIYAWVIHHKTLASSIT